MDSEGKISAWIAKLCGCFGILCAEAYDVFPEALIDHVRDQILTAGESLKQFYFNLTKDVFPVSKGDSPQEDVPTSGKQKESTGLPSDDKSTVSADHSEEGKSEDVQTSAKPKENTGLPPDDKSTLNADGSEEEKSEDVPTYTKPKENTGLPPDDKSTISADGSEEGKSEDLPTSAKQKENTGLPPDDKSTISADDSEEGKSEAVKSLSPASYIAPGGEVPITLVPKDEGEIGKQRGVSEDLPADEFKSDIVSTLESECSTEIQEQKTPSAVAIEHDALAKLSASPQPLVVGSCDDKDDISDILDPEFSNEIQDCKVPDDESSGEIHSIHKGSVQSLDDSSEETEGSDSARESESSSEESTSTDGEVTSSIGTISTRKSSSDTTIFGNEPLDQLPEVDLLVEPSNLDSTMFERLGGLASNSDSDSDTSDYSSSEETPKSDTGVARPIDEQKLDDNITTMFKRLEGLASNSDSDSDTSDYSNSEETPKSDTRVARPIDEQKLNDNITTMFERLGGLASNSDSDSDTSDYSSSEETPKSDTRVARPREEQKLDDNISQETDKPALSDMKFVEESSCETGSQGSPDAEANEENAEASQEKEWERLDGGSRDSDWEII